MKILALSKNDLRYPVHGSARIHLNLVGSISSLTQTLYLNIGSIKCDAVKIYVSDYSNFSSQFLQVSIPDNMEIIRRLPSIISFTPDVILCLSREKYYIYCSILARIFKVPLILFNDAMRYLYINEIMRLGNFKFRLREAFKGVVAIPYYFILTSSSDLSLTVSDDIIKKMNLLRNKMIIVRPPYLLLKDKSSIDHRIIPENLILYSGDLNTLAKFVNEFRDLNFVVTGPLAYYARNVFHRRDNLLLLPNISDADLVKLHEKIKLAIVLRNVMTGISMTILQELFFGRPVIANLIAVRGFEDFIGKGVYIAKNIEELKSLVINIYRNEDQYTHITNLIKDSYTHKLSPSRFSFKLVKYLEQVI
mgnify:CR=1 FL=1